MKLKFREIRFFEKHGTKIKDQWFLEGEVVQAYVKSERFEKSK